tara:strand:+ start:5358 stop:6494 length:1137 start_codon:yes stop_codon:yes gene_type:complete
MEIKVKEVNKEEKSKQQIEQELLEKHEEKFEDVQNVEQTEKVETPVAEESKPEETTEETVEEKTPSSELNDEDVLTYIKKRYDKDISSVDDLFAQKEANEELPDDVSAYLKYKKETGRGINDFYNLQKDFDSMDSDQLLAEYYGATEEGLDAIDIKDLIDDNFGFDEEIDEPKAIKKLKLAKKRELAKAKKYFNDQKDKYKVPLESSGSGLSGEEKEMLTAYKSYIDESKTVKEANAKRYDYFLKKTDEVFSNEFKGFEFKVGEKNLTFKPGEATELKNLQSDVNIFLNKYMDKDGLMKDASGYHRALSMAMNPEKFAKFFYDQGVADTVEDVSKKSKNINMDIRQAQQSVTKDGRTIRAVRSNDSGRGLKIRSIKRV